jgi:hypothetical protein
MESYDERVQVMNDQFYQVIHLIVVQLIHWIIFDYKYI